MTASYRGDALRIERTEEGARLHTAFQKLIGYVTSDGLTVESTADPAGRLRLSARALGRQGAMVPLPSTGMVEARVTTVAWVRPGLVEECSASADGLRQDFIVERGPAGDGPLCVALGVAGAQAEPLGGGGVELTLTGSGRSLAYTKLHVTDAHGRALPACMEVTAPDRISISVDDAQAAYPVTIDPTFSDANWVSLSPGIPGTDGPVNAVVVDGSGHLYVGGEFTFAGGVRANRIAKWDGDAWSALGSGMNGAVMALAVDGAGSVYAAGQFTECGGIQANHIAKWDGSAWSALGAGVNADVFCLALDPTGSLYAGGAFSLAGASQAGRVAKWSAGSWSALGAGVDGTVHALACAEGGAVYVGGAFSSAGGNLASRVAKWDGASWEALGSGIQGNVYALAVNTNGVLHAGGAFASAGGIAAGNIAKWDGSQWSALGAGVSGDRFADASVRALATDGSDVYAGGYFTVAGGLPSGTFAKWNGTAWSVPQPRVWGAVHSLAVHSSGIRYLGGSVFAAGGAAVKNVIQWNGNSWSALGAGLCGSVTALVPDGDGTVYAAVNYFVTNSARASYVAKWDGTAWTMLGEGMDGEINALVVDGAHSLHAGGTFTTAGGTAARFVARWSGSAWAPLAGGTPSAVRALAIDASGALVAGGANFVTKWNGAGWAPLATSVNGTVSTLLIGGNSALVAGGAFSEIGGIPAKNIASWNGASWTALGAGLQTGAKALAVDRNGVLHAVDSSSGENAGAPYPPAIVKWDGAAWTRVGPDLQAFVDTIAFDARNRLVAGGGFGSVGNVSARRVAVWDGDAWSPLGTGADGFVFALACDASGHLFLGGSFLNVGTTFSPSVAQYTLATAPSVGSPVSVGVTSRSAILGGTVIDDGMQPVLARGIVFSRTSQNSDPSIGGSDVTQISAGGTTGPFSLAVGGLTPGSSYSFKAYAVNAQGTSYSPVATFSTPFFDGYYLAAQRDTELTVTFATVLEEAAVGGGSVSSVPSTSARGGSIGVSALGFSYTPPAGFTGIDSFSVLITDGAGQTASGKLVVAVTVSGLPPNLGKSQAEIEASADGTATMLFRGAAGVTHHVQRSLDLQTWHVASVSTAGSDGVIAFVDAPPQKGAVYYRLATP